MRGAAVPYAQHLCMHGVHEAPLLDANILRLREQRRSSNTWARAARGTPADLTRLHAQHNVYLRTALADAGLACRKCRKKAMAEMIVEHAARSCRALRASPPLDAAAVKDRQQPAADCLALVKAAARVRGARPRRKGDE